MWSKKFSHLANEERQRWGTGIERNLCLTLAISKWSFYYEINEVAPAGHFHSSVLEKKGPTLAKINFFLVDRRA